MPLSCKTGFPDPKLSEIVPPPYLFFPNLLKFCPEVETFLPYFFFFFPYPCCASAAKQERKLLSAQLQEMREQSLNLFQKRDEIDELEGFQQQELAKIKHMVRIPSG